ncbi:FeoA family protein [Hahella sp. SMD15-11]|uniref:FeoA family protein n=1 Tax=Thermohahella caldifontis TaxID=3142973 RepID=A0AB39UV94_9GAMM
MTSTIRLKPRTRWRVIHMAGLPPALGKRMQTLGLLPGTTLELVRCAPLGDPWVVRVRGALFSLRGEDLKKLVVEAVDG